MKNTLRLQNLHTIIIIILKIWMDLYLTMLYYILETGLYYILTQI